MILFQVPAHRLHIDTSALETKTIVLSTITVAQIGNGWKSDFTIQHRQTAIPRKPEIIYTSEAEFEKHQKQAGIRNKS